MSRRRPHLNRWGGWRFCLGLALIVVAGCTPPNLPAPLPPETTGTAPTAPVVGGVISIGVDDDIRGFNPYVASQYSPAAAAISGLVLPGVFAPGAARTTDPPTALVTTVGVTATDPFTVTYNLNQGAAWSDGTPIAAEDFTYLWRQMTSNTDVVSPGGYQLIQNIQSADAGKTVIVIFKTVYSDWRTLFSPLLPARTLKDEVGGFSATLRGGIPVAGSRYRMDGYDPVIGQVELARNDKYWAAAGPPADTSGSVIFRAGASTDLVESLKRGDLQAIYLQPGAQAATALRTLDAGVRQLSAPLPTMDGLRFNTVAGRPTADPAVRRAVAAALDTADLRAALSGDNPSGVLTPTSQLSLPGDPDRAGGAPSDITDNVSGVSAALVDAGFDRTGLYFSARGTVLTLVLGYRIGDPEARTAARLVQSQLAAAGIQVNLVAQNEVDYYAPFTTSSVVDMVLGSTPRGPSDRSEAVSILQCGAAFDPVPTASSTTSSTTTSVTTGAGAAAATPICDAQVRTDLSAFLDDGAATDLDAVAWDDLTVLPLAQPVAVLALGPRLDAVQLPDDAYGMLWGGPLRDLPDWPTPT